MNNSEMFAIFWSDYPRRIAKKDALKAWLKLKLDEELFRTIIGAVRDQKEFLWHETEVRFIPYPASWLNGERWADELPDWKPIERTDADSEAMLYPGGRNQYKGRY